MNDDTAQENRLRKFASFFKGYMGVMPLVTAAVAPLLTMMKAIPVFESQKTTLATYSGLLGFLLLAWVFYVRGAFTKALVSVPRPPTSTASIRLVYLLPLIRAMWRLAANLLPLFLIVGSVFCYVQCLRTLDYSIYLARSTPAYADIVSQHDILEKWGQRESIPHSSTLQTYYLGIFLFAEMAFVLMALREYAYGVLNLSERYVLIGSVGSAGQAPLGK
jgi:hypothetical protein